MGRILSLVLLYEIEDVNRFPRVNEFLSYARLIKAQKSSAGKIHGHSGGKIGNAHLKWAFSKAAVLFLRQNPDGQQFVERLAKKHGKGKALSILAARLGRAVYYGGDREARRLTGESQGPSTNHDRRPPNACATSAHRSCAIRPLTRPA